MSNGALKLVVGWITSKIFLIESKSSHPGFKFEIEREGKKIGYKTSFG